MSNAKFRIKQNVWGNWYGYLGSKKIADFGTADRDAKEWLEQKQSDPSSVSMFEYDAPRQPARISMRIKPND